VSWGRHVGEIYARIEGTSRHCLRWVLLRYRCLVLVLLVLRSGNCLWLVPRILLSSRRLVLVVLRGCVALCRRLDLVMPRGILRIVRGVLLRWIPVAIAHWVSSGVSYMLVVGQR
jgi:hypothetical protein